MSEELFKIIGIIIFVGLLIYLVVKYLKFQTKIMEGITNKTDDINISPNLGSNAQSYADALGKSFNSLNDTLLVKNNKDAYEHIVINFDNYLNALMIENVLKMDQTNINEETTLATLEILHKLHTGKQSLNTLMKSIDSVST